MQNLIDKEKELKMEKFEYKITACRESVAVIQDKIENKTRKSKFEQKGLETILGKDGETQHTVESLTEKAKQVKHTSKKRYVVIERNLHQSGFIPKDERVEAEVKGKGRPRTYTPLKTDTFVAEIVDGNVIIVYKEAVNKKEKDLTEVSKRELNNAVKNAEAATAKVMQEAQG